MRSCMRRHAMNGSETKMLRDGQVEEIESRCCKVGRSAFLISAGRFGKLLVSVKDREIGLSLSLYGKSQSALGAPIMTSHAGEWCEGETAFLADLVDAVDQVVEVGAKFGGRTLALAESRRRRRRKRVKDTREFVVFESDQFLFQLLCGEGRRLRSRGGLKGRQLTLSRTG